MEAIDGGVLIGVAATMMLLFNGRVTGISGILGGLLNPVSKDKSWRILFLLGLLVGGFFLRFFHPVSFVTVSNAWRIDYMIAGFFVGFGTLLGNGCTSGQIETCESNFLLLTRNAHSSECLGLFILSKKTE